ncbi:MAG: YfcC family protein [Candidatus Krumholzibacteriia bacterium]
MRGLKRIQIPHVFALLTAVILICSIFTYVIPSGTYTRESRTYGSLTRTVVIPGTFDKLPRHVTAKGVLSGDHADGKASPVSILGFLSAIPRGMEGAADIIFFIFIIGGVFGILQRTGTINALLHGLLEKYSRSGPLLTVILMVAIGIGGSTLGMGEEFIPLVPVFLIVSKELGYDRIYGLALVMLAADMGFAAATTNPFTVQIAQGIAELPLGSGIQLRMVFFALCMAWTIAYVLRYGAKIKKDPSASVMAGDSFSLPDYDLERQKVGPSHVAIVVSCAAIFAFILYAVQKMGWWLPEMAGGFLLMGFVATGISRIGVSEATKAFVKGTEEMVVAALVVGFARAIQVVLVDGQIMDTLIFSAATVLRSFPNVVAAEGMLVFQTFLNFFIPSGSGQAAVTMPLMAPLADVLGLTRQTAVLAFTCGDGFSNTIIPTSGVLMAMLSLAGIPYQKWVRFVLPLFLQLIVLSGIFLAIAVWINYQ